MKGNADAIQGETEKALQTGTTCQGKKEFEDSR